MKFSIRNGNIKFNAEFYGKYSIICGDSAIGKTTLYNFLHDAEDGIVGYEFQIDVPYHVLDKRESIESVKSFTDTLLIADETCKLLHLSNTATALKESNNRFLIISRTVPAYLPLGVKNLYTLSSVAGVYNLVPVFSNSGIRRFNNIENIVTEDSDAGLEFFKENFYSETISSYGNGNLKSLLNAIHADNKTLAVFDSAGIIPVAKKLYRYLERYNVQYLDWDSFESYVLTQPAISEKIDYDDVNGESIEQISAERLSNLLNYSKGKLPKCLNYRYGCNNCSDSCNYKNQSFNCDLCININATVNKISAF